MKSITTIIFTFISAVFVAQTKLDTLVFNKVNEYRISMGVSELKWDTTSFKAAKLHTNYLVRTGKVGHKEDTLIEPKDRLKVFDNTYKWTVINEVALSTNLNINKTDSVDEKIADKIVDGWKKSPLHNMAILDTMCYYAGVECVVKIKPTGIKGIDNYQVVSTMVLVGGFRRKL